MNKKKYIVMGVVLLILVALACVLFFVFRKEKEADFSNNINEVMDSCMELTDNNKKNIKIESIDAYYNEDDNKLRKVDYFYHTVYSIYVTEDDSWHQVDEVHFGVDGDVSKYFNMAEFAKNNNTDEREKYEIAVEKGQHKSYTKEEIQELIDSYQYSDEE